ncbi:molybdopterin-binding protein [Celeribacter arenosi]|uniref:Molybdopterin-binding protein n=1 Tax=Celeribacter arenosi TaxID=792649 RepID=A0ABP7KHM3_9RHOB
MIFSERAVGASIGTILGHSVRLPDGGRIGKGTLIDVEQIDALQRAGILHVTVAELEPMDVGEDQAAEAVARAIVPAPKDANLKLTRAHSGRVNLVATAPGIVGLDAAALTELNALDESVTVATLPQYQRVMAGDLAATIKIIPFAVTRSILSHACEIARGSLRVRGVKVRTASLFETVIDGDVRGNKGEAATRERLARLGMDLIQTELVPHDAEALAEALVAAQGDIILILTASATVDRADTAPRALEMAGGEVTRFGIPVDPGNLLFAGHMGAAPVIGLPGCARSPALNGADWVLERLVCGVPITDRDIAMMGVGGLLKDVVARGAPRRID